MKYTYEAYEDNGGTIHLFALDSEQNVVWGAYYESESEIRMASEDWLKLAAQEVDPVENDWEDTFSNGHAGAVQDYKDCCKFAEERLGGARQIASSDWSTFLPLGIDIETPLGFSGKDFAVGCGLLTWCPICGYTCNCEPDRYGEFHKPERCDVCGESFE